MHLRVAMVAYAVFITSASVLLNKNISMITIIAGGILFVGSIFLELWKPRMRFLQILFLGLFHWQSQLNWSLPLYLILAGKETYRIRDLWTSILTSLFFGTIYSGIRISYSAANIYNYLVTFSDYLSFLAVVIIVRYIIDTEGEKQVLRQKFDHLSTHDSLTGLLNYQEFHRQLEGILKKPVPVALFLIDCTDLKSMNNERGFQSGDRILRNIAEILEDLFSNASMIARYGGDEFALAVRMDKHQNSIEKLTERLAVEFPKRAGIQVSYGYSIFPEEGSTKDDLILIAEQKLFSMKREVWLKREEHMLRSEKLRLVGELAAGMAHEIRNPLTTVRGFLQIAKESRYNIEPWYDVLMEEITRVSELTGEFLQFSKPHAMNFRIQPLRDCVQRVVSLMESEAILLGHQLQLEWDPTVQILMDKDKIVQVLVNLVKNAFEAMETQGTVSIRVSRDNGNACLTVSDTGPGIPEGHLEQIFHPFFTTKKNGTGLGLAICQKIIQDHGGIIEIESTSKGTAFHISFPSIT